MANEAQAKVTIWGDASSLTRATRKAKGDLQGLSRTSSNIARTMGKTLGTLGVALSLGAVTKQLEAATKAAVADAKSQALLAKQMSNTVRATKEQTAAVEESITKLSLMAAVPDDEIRPAFAQLLRSTKSVTKATKLTSLALDVAAGTGKDVATVSKALSKAYAGNTGALSKMGINVKKGGNWMKELRKQFRGMADVQARQDPVKRLQTTFGELQEKLGQGMIPALNKVADWFNANYDKIAKFFTDAWNSDAIVAIKGALKTVWEKILKPFIEWVSSADVQAAIGKLFESIGGLFKSIGDFAASDAGKVFKDMAAPAVITALTILSNLLDAIADTLDRISGKKPMATQANRDFGAALNPFATSKQWTGNVVQRQGNFSNVGQTRPITEVKVYVQPNDGKSLLDSINKELRSRGHGALVFK